jgi:hypothetical protein
LASGAPETNFVIEDFLKVVSAEMSGSPFDAICSNPPFVRFNLVSRRKLDCAYRLNDDLSPSLPRNSSYWAYFLLHSLSFLAEGGRIAAILPMSFLYAKYARNLREHLCRSFEKVRLALLNGHAFEGSEERVLILLAEGFLSQNKYFDFRVLSSLASLREFCSAAKSMDTPKTRNVEPKGSMQDRVISGDTGRILRELGQNENVTLLGDWAEIRIGVVTGANDFFVLEESARRNFGIPATLFKPVVSHAEQIKGLIYTRRDHRTLKSLNRPVLLLKIGEQSRIAPSLRRYIRMGREKGVAERTKCRQRNPWYVLKRITRPPAFMHYMSSLLPHIVLNDSDATSTNTIHHLRWKRPMSNGLEKSVGVAAVSTLTQLSVELSGRSYGGGVLKLEPSECRAVLLAVPPPSRGISRSFRDIDLYLREGDRLEAMALADQIVLSDYLGMRERHIIKLRDEWQRLVKQRLTPAKLDLHIEPEPA